MSRQRRFTDGSRIVRVSPAYWRAETKHRQISPPFAVYADALAWLQERGQGQTPVTDRIVSLEVPQ